jgi:hypothetical protein
MECERCCDAIERLSGGGVHQPSVEGSTVTVVRSVLFALVLALTPLSPLASLDAFAAQQHITHIGASRSEFVEAVRRATESFRDIRNAPPGYGAVRGCVSGPDQGAMGVRHKTHGLNDRPTIEGQLLQFVDSPNRFGLPAHYEIHVWAWQDNPNGMFVDWKPKVSCEGQ